MVSKKLIFYKFIKYVLFFLLFVLLQYAEIEKLHPFAYGMLFALVWCNQNIYIISPLYIVSGLIADFSLYNAISLVFCVFVFVMFYLLHKKLKKPLSSLLIGLYAFISQGAYLFFNSFSGENFFRAIICVVLGMIALYAYLFFMQGLLLRGLKRKFLLDELISAGVLVIALSIGICSLPDYNGIIQKTLLVFLVIIFSSFLSGKTSFAFSICLGFGSLICTKDFTLFVVIVLFALILNLTKNSKKIFSILGICLTDVFLNLYLFNYYDIFLLSPVLFCSLIYLLMPNKFINSIRSYIICENEEFGLRRMINRSREIMFKRLYEVGEVFKEMQNIYLKMSKGKIDAENTIEMLSSKINDDVCQKCSERNICFYNNLKQNDEELKNLISLALARGKISIVDIPSSLISKCEKIYVLINAINSLAEEYRSYSILSSSINNSRLLISDQLMGVRGVIDSLSKDVKKTISFDVGLENKIKEELLYEHILCIDAVVYLKEQNITSISLVIKTKDLDEQKIQKTTEKIVKSRLDIKSIESSNKPGFSIVILNKMPAYDVVFGSVGVLKNGSNISGDTHSVIRISNDKVFMSVCDGMGSGEKAYDVSAMSLGLVEKFYQAGFDSNLIISNVNKLLSLRDEENFSAIDICVFDLNCGYCELIKIGATIGFIKQKDKTIIVETSALPLGILEKVNPTSYSYALNDGDMVVLLTDGVVDVFEDVIYLRDIINETQTDNPQVLAETILSKTLEKTGQYAEDDMTVLVGKIWKKI